MGVSAMPILSFGEKEADKASQSATECAALVDKLCAENGSIKAAVVSADMFLALAKPATAGVALKLIEEKGLEADDKIITLLLTIKARAGNAANAPFLCETTRN